MRTHPNSLEAFYGSEVETSKPFVDYEDYKRRSMQYREGEISCVQIENMNNLVEGHLNGITILRQCPILFPSHFRNACYLFNYIYGDDSTQVTTVELPLIKYKSGLIAYKLLKWRFDYVWRMGISNQEMQKMSKEDSTLRAFSLLMPDFRVTRG